jgi:enolase-phosphatase E1
MTPPKAIVTDIEGTTSSIDFVHQVLFPYAREALPDFVRDHAEDADVAPLLQLVREETGEPAAGVERVIESLLRWIDEDQKITALKALQGFIWQHGYASGDFTGHVYHDAVRNMRKWQQQDIRLFVYSSGSAKAQQLLFAHSDAGDLRALFSGYFDTRVGNKRDVGAYREIAKSIGERAADVLFLSDVTEELDAAAAAGMRTVHVVRDEGMAPGNHPVAHDFDDIIF